MNSARRTSHVAVILCLTALGASCAEREEEVRVPITFLSGRGDGVYDVLGEALAQAYSSKVPGVLVSAQRTSGSVFNIRQIQEGNASIGFAQADTAYLGYRRSVGGVSGHLRAIAALYVNTVQLFVRNDSQIRRVLDLRGRRLGVGGAGSPTEVAARIILETHGLTTSDVSLTELKEWSQLRDHVEQIQNQSLDAGVFVTSFPVPPIAAREQVVGMRMIPLDSEAVARIRGRYSFYKPIAVPKGTYRDQTEDIQTIGIDTLLVCREDLSEELAYQFTRVLFESLPQLRQLHAAAEHISAEQGPATSIPLHAGAARYYREHELKR